MHRIMISDRWGRGCLVTSPPPPLPSNCTRGSHAPKGCQRHAAASLILGIFAGAGSRCAQTRCAASQSDVTLGGRRKQAKQQQLWHAYRHPCTTQTPPAPCSLGCTRVEAPARRGTTPGACRHRQTASLMEFGRLTKKVLVLPLCVRAIASNKAAAANHCQPCQRHAFGSFDPAGF